MDIETLVVGFVSGVVAGIMLLVGTWVFVLPKVPGIIVPLLKEGKQPKGWFAKLVYSLWQSGQKAKDKNCEKDAGK